MALRFGTDGLRGPAEELSDELVAALGRAAARCLPAVGQAVAGPVFLIGRDPRLSGERIEASLSAGVRAEGSGPWCLGTVPTPAVAWSSARFGVPAAMISASHNPYGDNGVKLFAAGGCKLPDRVEAQIEDLCFALLGDPAPAPDRAPQPAGCPSVQEVLAGYCDSLVASLEGRDLGGSRVVLDCANGSASAIAGEVFGRAGADVVVINAAPDGRNINDGCGSTHPEGLQRAVVAQRADAGLAFDGDADRVLAVDERGALVDGDHLLAILAHDMRRRGRLPEDTVVVTVMSNLGFRLAMEAEGIKVVETPVGDRHVLEALAGGGWALGGEQSGHVVMPGLATTGDGMLTGLQLLDVLVRSGEPLSALAATSMTRLPQVLRNVAVDSREAVELDDLADVLADAEAVLGGRGRVLVRTSGTEPLVRVMVEADETSTAEAVAERLCAAVASAWGSSTQP